MSSARSPHPQALLILLAALLAWPWLIKTSLAPVSTMLNQLAAVGLTGLVLLGLGLCGLVQQWPRVLLGSIALAGLISALIAVLQILGPAAGWDGSAFTAASTLPGRAVAHLRQPNHLASLLLWAAFAMVALQVHEGWSVRWIWPAIILLMTALVMTGSRTGLVGVGLLVLWGVLDRRLPQAARQALWATPAICALAWWILHASSDRWGFAFGSAQHVLGASGDISSSRFAIWRDTLELIKAHPWSGVGWGHFNLAWSLTPFPERAPAFFDHTHNLVLQLVVELGLPLGLLCSAMLAALLGWALQRAWRSQGPQAILQRAAAGLLLVMALHSQLEYPLWYAYFLVPTLGAAWVALNPKLNVSRMSNSAATRASIAASVCGAVMAIGAAAACLDYSRISAIYAPRAGAAPLQQRMAQGQGAWLFSAHADYAVATMEKAPAGQAWPPHLAHAFAGATTLLLDTRLMMAWAQAYAARNGPGDRDRARHLAARVREFRNPASTAWLAECDSPAENPRRAQGPTQSPAQISTQGPPPFQCEAPQQALRWTDFLEPPGR